MSRQKTWHCPGCGGTVTGTRQFTIETSIANHTKSCPGRARIGKETT